MKNLYEILDLSQNSSFDEIKKSYRILALKFHPDKNNSPDAQDIFIEITSAYEILKDPVKRKIYDENLFSNSLRKITPEYNSWRTNAKEKADYHSNMPFDKFEINLNEELRTMISNSPNFGCLAFIIFGFILSFYLLFNASEKGNDTVVSGMVVNIIVYGILVIWLYPRFTKKYKNDRKDIYKK